MTNDDYTKITWPEVRKGDVLMRENGDRLTVERAQWEIEFPVLIHTATSRLYADVWIAFGFAPYRKQPELPNEPGVYLDRDGDLWELADSGEWPWQHGGASYPDQDAAEYAPFTRLVPMPTEEQIRETLFKTDPGTIYGVDAVVEGMKSLLGGGDDE